MKVIGCLTCPYCGPFDILGIVDGTPVTVSIGLYDCIGRDAAGLWILNCPKQHHVLKLIFTSAQEWLEGEGVPPEVVGVRGHFPAPVGRRTS